MGFKAVDSQEKVARATLLAGEAPKHTHPDHVGCAYYVITEDVASGLPDQLFIEMECPHHFSAGGAWYNEDYVRQLKQPLEDEMDDIRPTSPEMDKADAAVDPDAEPYDFEPTMTAVDLHVAVASDQPAMNAEMLFQYTQNHDFKVVTAINFRDPDNELRFTIVGVYWDEDRKEMVLVQGEEV